MELQVGVKILLENKDGKYLLLHRNWDKYPEVKKDNSWDIVGGRIEKGTPLLENLKREIFEETKLTLVEEPKFITAQDIFKPDKHVVRITYIGQIEGEPKLDEYHDSYKWVTLEEIKNEKGLDQYFQEVFEKYILK